jgi:CubicO group peptidase (beta-lactamase class C family)
MEMRESAFKKPVIKVQDIKSKLLLFVLSCAASAAAVLPAATAAESKPSPGDDLHAKVDAVVRDVLSAGTVPSVSLAVVQDGRLALVQAYGWARLTPKQLATSAMRYSIGSVSKQFTAAAILMLVEEGKLKLDDPVSQFLPQLTRAGEVTVRQLLSHTSGYQDYWPQDYVIPSMLEPVSAIQIVDRWARKPLDFEPGTDWQYSNTGYVAAGLIVEQVSGQPLFEFLRQRIFVPLGMRSVLDVSADHLTESDAVGHMHYGLGPPRAAPKEGKGWLFAAGELAMTAEDLAKWDISLMNRTLLKPESYQAMESTGVLKNGLPSSYGLGLDVTKSPSGPKLSHGGEVSGFMSLNVVYPQAKAAVVALSNGEGAAVMPICKRVSDMLLPEEDSKGEVEKGRRIFEGLRHGNIDRSLLTTNANFYFSEQALKDFAAGFKGLGKPLRFIQRTREERGGMTLRVFGVEFRRRKVLVLQRTLPDGKIEQYQVVASI